MVVTDEGRGGASAKGVYSSYPSAGASPTLDSREDGKGERKKKRRELSKGEMKGEERADPRYDFWGRRGGCSTISSTPVLTFVCAPAPAGSFRLTTQASARRTDSAC